MRPADGNVIGRGLAVSLPTRSSLGDFALEGRTWDPMPARALMLGSPKEGKLASDLRPIAPQHRLRPPTTRYQQARRDNNMHDQQQSAKPPSPVQIRAAPPNLLSNLGGRRVGRCQQGVNNQR